MTVIPVAVPIVTSVSPVYDGNNGDAASYAPSVVFVDILPSRSPRFPAVSVSNVTVAPRHIPPRSPRSKCRVTAMVNVTATALAVATATVSAFPRGPVPCVTAVAEVQLRPLL